VVPPPVQQEVQEVAQGGAFFTLITIESDGADNGDIHLQGGTVNGTDVTTTSLKLYDIGTDTWEGDPDDHLYLEVEGEGEIADGVLLPGFTITSVTPTIGAPSEHEPPTLADATGHARLSLGVFFNNGFFPAKAGNRGIAVCLGSFVITPSGA
jgi:hypothetical protein